MRPRHLMTAVTMLVLVGILVLGVILGVNSLFAPLPGSDEPAAEPSASCSTKAVKKGQKIRTRQVQVSVFNGGTRAGLADETMDRLARRGFKRGDVGNAPSGTSVRRVRVYTTDRNDAAAMLVARQFGKKVKVQVREDDLGPGIDVVVGNDLHKLAKAKPAIVVKRSSSVCVPIPSSSTQAG
ncbi:MAG: LytR C-terminal domain-containing protein [Nocardioidaceae bacterium]|nr:LytR C-terminal domain-containing protein [Nocardioidaceae bacterium]NUS52075.1 LytR C-terminal domain-containing protein [Nocardioidaceae bacterium]